MQIPRRKAELARQMARKDDNYITQSAYDSMEKKLLKLKASMPSLAAEVTRTQEMGDLSENAAYQEAKFTLRRTMGQIERLKQRIKDALIIEKPSSSDIVSIGSIVAIVENGKQRQFEILGSTESNPLKGRISHLSPIGSALIGHAVGDEVAVKVHDREHHYQIISIE